MDLSVIDHINIVMVASILLIALTRLRLFHQWFRSLIANGLIFFLLISIVLILFWPMDPGPTFKGGDALGTLRIIRIVIISALAFVALVYSLFRKVFPRSTALYIYALYIFVCSVSAFYSPNWLETLWKSFELGVFVLLALVIRKEILRSKINQRQIFEGISYIVFALVVFALIGGLLQPEAAFSIQDGSRQIATASMGGIVPRITPNTLGQFSSMVTFSGFVLVFLQRRISVETILLLAVGVAGMGMAHARTSILALTLLVIVFVIMTRFRAFYLIPFGVFAIMFGSEYLVEFLVRGQDLDLFLSMSGRTSMWSVGWDAVAADPWFGKGLYAGHKELDITLGVEYSTLDNTYLESLVDVGFVGTAFLIAFVAIMLKRMFVLVYNSPKYWSHEFWWINVSSGYVFLMFVRSLVGPSFQIMHFNLLILLVTAGAWESYRQSRKVYRARSERI